MDIPLDEVIHVEAISSGATGVAVDADSTPTFAVYEESTDTDIGVGGNMTKRTSLTGDYRASFTASAANGFDVGKWYSVIGSATIGGIATKGVLARFRIVAAEIVAGYPVIDIAKLLGAAWLTPAVAGTPDVNTKTMATDAISAAAWSQAASDELIARLFASTLPAGNPGEFGNTVTGAAAYAVIAATDTATLLTRVTAAVYTYWLNLNVGGLVASSAEATSIQNNTRVVRVVPAAFERPDSGSTAFVIELALYDEVGNMEAPDSAPTLAVVNQSLTSRNANLDSTTMTLVSTGRYRSTYTIDTNHAIEQLVFAFSVIEGGNTRVYMNTGQVVDTTAVDFTSTDRTTLNAIASSSSSAASSASTAATQATAAATQTTGAAIRSAIGLAAANLDTQFGLVATAANLATLAGKFTGITLLARWLGALMGKTADATTLTEIQATTAGAGYLNTTDSLEAIRDRGDAAWTTGGGGGGGGGDATLANQETIIDALNALNEAGGVVMTSPVATTGLLTLVRGDDYYSADGAALEWTSTEWPDLTGATIRFSLQRRSTGTNAIDRFEGSVVTPTGTAKVRVELTAAQTDDLAPGKNLYIYDVEATLTGGNIRTLVHGQCDVIRDSTRPAEA